MCHCEEQSDVAVSNNLETKDLMYAEIANVPERVRPAFPLGYAGLAMTHQ